MNRAKVILIALLAVLGEACDAQPSISSAKVDPQKCVAAWNALPSVDAAGLTKPVDSLIDEWQKVKPICGDTGIYEVRLGGLYYSKGDMAQAKQTIAGVHPVIEEYAALREELDLMIKLREASKRGDSPSRISADLERSFLDLAARHPNHCFIKSAEAEFRLVIEDYSRAADLASQAIACDPGAWTWYRIGAIANRRAQRNQQAAEICSNGVDLNRNLMSEPRFMLSCAGSYVAIGDYETAESILTIIDDRMPRLKEAEEYRQMRAALDARH